MALQRWEDAHASYLAAFGINAQRVDKLALKAGSACARKTGVLPPTSGTLIRRATVHVRIGAAWQPQLSDVLFLLTITDARTLRTNGSRNKIHGT